MARSALRTHDAKSSGLKNIPWTSRSSVAFRYRAAGESGGREIKRDGRIALPKGAKQRNSGGNFAYRNGMQPDGVRRRPRERLGEQSKTFREAGQVFTPFCNAPDKVGNYKR